MTAPRILQSREPDLRNRHRGNFYALKKRRTARVRPTNHTRGLGLQRRQVRINPPQTKSLGHFPYEMQANDRYVLQKQNDVVLGRKW